MNSITTLKHAIKEGSFAVSKDDYIIELDAEQTPIETARQIKDDDVFLHLSLEGVDRLAIVCDENIDARTILFRRVHPDWRRTTAANGDTLYHLAEGDRTGVLIRKNKNRGDYKVITLEFGEPGGEQVDYTTSFSHAIKVAERVYAEGEKK